MRGVYWGGDSEKRKKREETTIIHIIYSALSFFVSQYQGGREKGGREIDVMGWDLQELS